MAITTGTFILPLLWIGLKTIFEIFWKWDYSFVISFIPLKRVTGSNKGEKSYKIRFGGSYWTSQHQVYAVQLTNYETKFQGPHRHSEPKSFVKPKRFENESKSVCKTKIVRETKSVLRDIITIATSTSRAPYASWAHQSPKWAQN